MSKYSLVILIALAMIFMSLSTACSKEAPVISTAQQKMIDTLVLEQTKVLRIELDSLCELRSEVEIATARDSMIEVRFA